MDIIQVGLDSSSVPGDLMAISPESEILIKMASISNQVSMIVVQVPPIIMDISSKSSDIIPSVITI